MVRWTWRSMLLGMLVCAMTTVEVAAANWADRLFTEAGHDFGPVPRGAKVRHPFVLFNRLNEPLTILNVRASCGCTTGRALASQVMPGESAVVEAEMDTRNFVGKKATVLFVSVVTASGREAEVRLGVSSLILSDVVLNPGGLDFGVVARGQSPAQSLTIDRIGASDWRITRVLSASRVLTANLVETSRTGNSVGYTLQVALRPDAPAGPVRDEIRLVTNDAETPSIPVLVTAMVNGDLSATPSLLSMGAVRSAAGVQGKVVVRASRPFQILAVEGAGDGFKVAATDGSRKPMHVLTIAYRPEEGSPRGDLTRTFRVTTDLPGEPPVEVTATLHVDP